MEHPRIYLQVGENEVSWCEHRVNDDDVEYVKAEPQERDEAVIASSFTCPSCATEFTVTAVPEVAKEVLIEGDAAE